PPLRVIIHEFSRLHDGTVAEFISAAGAAPDAAEVVHIQNAGGQHYEALTAQQPGGAAVKPFSAMPPEIAEPAPALPRQPEAERWLVLDDNQQEIINHCVPEHFYPLFSFISAFPLVVSEPGQPAPQVYASGQRLSAEQPVSELPDAIMISSSATTTLVTIKRAGFQDLSVSLPDADRVAILAAIPEDIYQTSDTELICALFIMTPEILYEKLTDHGREQYQQLISLTDLDNDDAIRERLDAAATFFANAPGGDTIPKGEFFRALNTNIEYTLLPSGKRKNFLKTHPGTSPVIITGKLIHYILAYLGSPPAEMYKPVTTLALQFADKSKTMTKYLYTLAKELPTGNEPHFSDAISQVMHYFKHDDINLKKIIRKIPEEIFHELEDKPIAATATQKRLEYYYSLFANAIENSNLDNDFIGSVMEAWWPILSATSYPFIKKKYPEMKKLLAANIRNNEEKYKDVCTLEDRVLSIFLSFVFQHPEAWSEYVAENFRRILSEVGGDGNTPLATIHLVDFFNDRVSAPKAHEVFRQLIGKNVKTKISNAISMLLAIETYPPNMITHIYHTSVEEAVKIYMFYWEKYRQIKIDNLGENQVVVVDNNQSLVYIDKRSKWQKHIEQKLDKPVILLPGMAGKVHSKDKFLSSYIYTNSDADPLLSAMLISFSGPLYRDDNKIMQQVKSKKRIIFLQEIIDANRVEDSSPARINQLNARLQHIIETTPLPPSLKKNKLNKQEEAKINEYNQLIESVLTIQIMLLSQGYGKNTDKLLSHNVIKNLCAIGIKTKVQSPLNILSEKAASDKITEETYLAIITRAIEQSLVNSQNPISDFIRQSVLASACETLKSREKLFLALAKIPLNQTYEQAGYGLFVDVARKEMERAAQGSEPGDRLSDLERQAFSTLLTAFPASWKIFTDAHKASSRKVINTEWLINSQCFLQAAPEVQILLLNFLANESQTVPTPFITQCLTTMHNGSALLPSDPNNADALKTAGYSIYDLENTLNRICNFLQQYDPSCFSDTIDAIFTLSQSLREKKGIRDISSALTNSLKGILNAIKTSDEPQYQRLLQQYPQLVKEKPLDVVYAPLFNKEESITYRTSDISSTSEPERVSSTSETAAEKTREEEKPKDPMIIYIGKEWQKACVDEQFSKTLPKATAALMAGDFQRVKFHSYANSHYFTFDVKRNDNQHVQRKGKGRVDGRAMLLQGSRNKWLFLGVGSHKEATEKFKLYKTTPQETINKMIGNPDSASQRLRFDNSSKTLQLLDTAESAPETR
ncbi:hypothetical protein, partial [Pantoea sp. B65]|uniref:hypothetical protein n=1 Tax=Pantoea sp. B65 TaxID=2813359 RepID=UPI0039B39640